VRGYAICTEPRSGSNYLCQLLSSTGRLGRPLEYFNGPARRALEDFQYPDDPEDQLQEVLTRGATPNGLYGVKLFSHQSDELRHLGWASRLPGLRFIHLERRDLLGQAISRVRADQTGQFRAYPQVQRSSARYSRAAISRRLNEIVVGQARWRLFFSVNGVVPLLLLYEQIVADPSAAAKQVAEFLEEPLPDPFTAAKVDLQIQRDDLTEEWRRRFLAESGRLHALPTLEVSGMSRARHRLGELIDRASARLS
jgi:LPS sulfotransferase NodH